MTADIAGLTEYVRAHPSPLARAWVGRSPRRGVLAIDANIRAGQRQTRVVLRAGGQPDVVLYDRLIAAGDVEIKVGRRFVDVRDLLPGAAT